jgi:nitroreductase
VTVAIQIRERLRTGTVVELVRAATQAPSSHNAQPWRFHFAGDEIELRADLSRRLPAIDPDDRELYIGLGCALENLVLTAASLGLAADVRYLNGASVEPDGTLPAARVVLTPAPVRMSHALVGAIPWRQTTRSRYRRRPMPAVALHRLEAAAVGDCEVRLITDAYAFESVIELVEDATRRQYRDPAAFRELVRWMRFSRRDARLTRDGLAAATLGLPWLPHTLGRLATRFVASPEREAGRVAERVRTASALAVFATERRGPGAWMSLGRDFQRFALQATALGIRYAHVSAPCEVPADRRDLEALLQLGRAQPLLMLRLGYAPPMPRSLRRPVEDVIVRERALVER